MLVRSFISSDYAQVLKMDEESGFFVSQWVGDLEPDEEQDYSFGLFEGGKLIGYCTLGYADDCPDEIDKHCDHSADSLLLSDVFIKKEYRHKGYGLKMIKKAIHEKADKETVYLQIMRPELKNFYSRMGFTMIEGSDSAMVWYPFI